MPGNPYPDTAKKQLRLFMITCGNKDGLIDISQGFHSYMKERDLPYIWHVDGNGHDPVHWGISLYELSQRIFH